MNREKVAEVINYFLIWILFFILHSASISNLHFFAIGMLIALIWIDYRVLVLVPIFILAGFLSSFTFESLWQNSLACVVILIIFYLHIFIKKPLNYFSLGVMCFLAQIGKIILLIIYPDVRLDYFLELILSEVVLYCFVVAMQCFKLKGLRKKYLCDEILSICALIFSCALGLGQLNIYFYYAVFAFLVLIIPQITAPTGGIIFSIAFGLGGACCFEDFLLLSSFVGVGSIAAVINSERRILSYIGVVLGFILFSVYFHTYTNEFILLAFALGGLIYVLLPKKILYKIKSCVVTEVEWSATKEIINQTREELKNSLLNLSDVFLDMKSLYYSMGCSENFDSAVKFLCLEVKKRVCLNCGEQDCRSCMDESIENMLTLAYERGRLSIIDAPPNLCAGCGNLASLITAVNDVIKLYKAKENRQKRQTQNYMLLGNQSSVVSSILTQSAISLDEKVGFDSLLEERIKENLVYANINCVDVVAYQKNGKLVRIVLTLLKNTNLKKVKEVLFRSTHIYFDEDSITEGYKAGYRTVTYLKCAQYDILYGCHGAVKQDSSVSGDTYSITKVNKSQVLIAVSDGMGSGKNAHEMSECTLNMLEDFFSVGLESEFSIESVNKLLIKRDKEVFSALDLGLIDLERGRLNLIKLGGASSFLIRNDEIREIKPASMPLGMLDEMKPKLLSFSITDGDYIVLLSDGVVDSFPSIDAIYQMMHTLPKLNPQLFAQNIIENALHNCGEVALDDMTALVIRIVKKLR